MTVADRIAAELEERGPLPACDLAAAVRKRRAVVIEALYADARFVRRGKTKATRWELAETGTFTPADAAAHWDCPLSLAEQFVRDFEVQGLVERINGNGRLRVTDHGCELSTVLHDAADAWGWMP
jgi:hypothetical protein